MRGHSCSGKVCFVFSGLLAILENLDGFGFANKHGQVTSRNALWLSIEL